MEDMKEFEKELMVEDSENILNTYKRFPVVLKEGKGATLKDYKGKEYIDFSSGIGTNSFAPARIILIIKSTVGLSERARTLQFGHC